jgi:hypothetical protein
MTVWRKITAPNRIKDWSKKGTEAFNHLAPNRYIEPPTWTMARQGEVVSPVAALNPVLPSFPITAISTLWPSG